VGREGKKTWSSYFIDYGRGVKGWGQKEQRIRTTKTQVGDRTISIPLRALGVEGRVQRREQERQKKEKPKEPPTF